MCISHKTEICHFVHIIIIILSPLYSLSLPFFLEKNYTAFLTESFHVSVTYLQMHTRQIANQPSLENFISSSSPLYWRSSVYWRSRLTIKLRDFVFLRAKFSRSEKFQVPEHLTRSLLGPILVCGKSFLWAIHYEKPFKYTRRLPGLSLLKWLNSITMQQCNANV